MKNTLIPAQIYGMNKLVARLLGVFFAKGKNYRIGSLTKFEPPCQVSRALNTKSNVSIGAFTGFNQLCQHGYVGNAHIGRYTSIGPGAIIGIGTHPTQWLSVFPGQYMGKVFCYRPEYRKTMPVQTRVSTKGCSNIGNDVMIGANAVIIDGVNIGDGAIIGAGAVVTKDVPPYAIVGGVPAKVIRYRFDESTIKELSELQWWRYRLADFGTVPWDDVHAAIKVIKEKISTGEVSPYEPGWITNQNLRLGAILKKMLHLLLHCR